jgi:hypothetical protein
MGQFGFVGRAILPAAGFQPAPATENYSSSPLPSTLAATVSAGAGVLFSRLSEAAVFRTS